MQVGVEAIPVRPEKANLWVGWRKDFGSKSWKVFYAEKPYTNYVLGMDYQANPEAFTIEDVRRILTQETFTTEVRTLIQNVSAGKQYKVKVYAYDTRTQNKVINNGTSREVYAPVLENN